MLVFVWQYYVWPNICLTFCLSEEEINNMKIELEKYNIQMPAFSKIGGILANELSVDEAACEHYLHVLLMCYDLTMIKYRYSWIQKFAPPMVFELMKEKEMYLYFMHWFTSSKTTTQKLQPNLQRERFCWGGTNVRWWSFAMTPWLVPRPDLKEALCSHSSETYLLGQSLTSGKITADILGRMCRWILQLRASKSCSEYNKKKRKKMISQSVDSLLPYEGWLALSHTFLMPGS